MNRQLLGILALASWIASPAIAAAPQGDEIELRIESLGEVSPDAGSFSFAIEASGHSVEGTLADLDKKYERANALFSTLGIAGSNLKWTPEPWTPEEMATRASRSRSSARAAERAARAASEAAARASAQPQSRSPYSDVPQETPKYLASGTLAVSVNDIEKMQPALKIAREIGDSFQAQQSVRYFARDQAAAEREALARAVSKARAQADIHASAIGHRVVRILRLSNSRPAISSSDLIELVARIGPGQLTKAMMGTTFAGVTIDYAIAPK